MYALRTINLSRVIKQSSFGIDEFMKYQHVLDRISGHKCGDLDIYLTGSMKIVVREENVNVNKLADLVLWLAKWLVKGGYNNEEAIYQHIYMGSVDITDSYNECGTDYIEFVNSITGGKIKDIYLRQMEAENHGARTVAYIGAGQTLNIRLKKNSAFIKMCNARIENDDSRLYVFYANQTKEQAFVAWTGYNRADKRIYIGC